ncbi:MAG: hypothetical protein A3E84_00060 [Gammaproteobacteria bacterium RIFCSPHIGHO2_12_FULL_42_13]|nr:MAG: hypothetical protein A3E84_00060 [Gammaproteobacteria bacterium RIFCSPHIGHO2_12_FULL_42_13]
MPIFTADGALILQKSSEGLFLQPVLIPRENTEDGRVNCVMQVKKAAEKSVKDATHRELFVIDELVAWIATYLTMADFLSLSTTCYLLMLSLRDNPWLCKPSESFSLPIPQPLRGHNGNLLFGKALLTQISFNQYFLINRERTQTTHAITQCAFSADGKTVVGVADRIIWFWDSVTGANTNTLIGDQRNNTDIKGFCLSPDMTTLASYAYSSLRVSQWSIVTKKVVMSFQHVAGNNLYITVLTYSPDGKILAIGYSDGGITLHSASSRGVHRQRIHTTSVNCLAFSPKDKMLATIANDKKIILWNVDVDTIDLICIFDGHQSPIFGLAFSPDGKTLVSSSLDNTTRFWKIETKSEIGKLPKFSERVDFLAFSPDGKTLAASSWDGFTRLWDTESKKEVVALLVGHCSQPSFSPDGKKLAICAAGGKILVWDVKEILRDEKKEKLPHYGIAVTHEEYHDVLFANKVNLAPTFHHALTVTQHKPPLFERTFIAAPTLQIILEALKRFYNAYKDPGVSASTKEASLLALLFLNDLKSEDTLEITSHDYFNKAMRDALCDSILSYADSIQNIEERLWFLRGITASNTWTNRILVKKFSGDSQEKCATLLSPTQEKILFKTIVLKEMVMAKIESEELTARTKIQEIDAYCRASLFTLFSGDTQKPRNATKGPDNAQTTNNKKKTDNKSNKECCVM